jgi:hypothetical protein
MKYQKWNRLTIILILLLLVSISLINYLIDPFSQYRISSLTWFEGKNQRYINGGLAKNYSYESLIVGSSMVENFLISKSEEVFPQVIKLPLRGGSAYEVKLMMSSALKYNKSLKNIILGLDFYALNGDYRRTRYGALPLYLYDDNYFNDYKYLLNYDTFLKSCNLFIKRIFYKSDICFQYEYMYQWQHEFKDRFSKKNVWSIFEKREKNIGRNFDKDAWSYAHLTKSFRKNILTIIEKNPQINFYIFYPPKSILTYKWWEEKNILDNLIQTKKYIYMSLRKYENVKLYDFQTAYEITMDLDNYIDLGHYHQKVNSWMIDSMKCDKFLVTDKNFIQNNKEFLQSIYEYELNSKKGL